MVKQTQPPLPLLMHHQPRPSWRPPGNSDGSVHISCGGKKGDKREHAGASSCYLHFTYSLIEPSKQPAHKPFEQALRLKEDVHEIMMLSHFFGTEHGLPY